MRKIEIELDEKEEFTLEYVNYQYQGIKLIVNQFLSGKYEYDENHYSRMINTLTEKYTELQKCLFKILDNHGYKDISIIEFNYAINKHTLEILI